MVRNAYETVKEFKIALSFFIFHNRFLVDGFIRYKNLILIELNSPMTSGFPALLGKNLALFAVSQPLGAIIPKDRHTEYIQYAGKVVT